MLDSEAEEAQEPGGSWEHCEGAGPGSGSERRAGFGGAQRVSEAGEADTLKHRVAGTGPLRSTLCVGRAVMAGDLCRCRK